MIENSDAESIINDTGMMYGLIGHAVGSFYAALTFRGVPQDTRDFFASTLMHDLVTHHLEHRSVTTRRLDPRDRDFKKQRE